MPKVTAPFFALGASGQLGKAFVNAKWKGRAYVRSYVKPANPNTSGQQETRTAFSFLNDIWRYWPSAAIDAWNLYATNNRYAARNGFLALNVSPLRGATDLSGMTLSPAAGSGVPAVGATFTAGAGQITIAATAPTLPTGWTIVEAIALAIANVDPSTTTTSDIAADVDATAPYSIVLTGLTAGQEYLCGIWLKFLKPDGTNAYGQAEQGTATPT